MELSFPTKLADYTAAGLPILIYGPSYCSAVGWAALAEREMGNAAASVVEQGGGDALANAVERLEDPARRYELAAAAIAAGKRYFTQERSLRVLYGNLCRER
jgi:hypothetical protein